MTIASRARPAACTSAPARSWPPRAGRRPRASGPASWSPDERLREEAEPRREVLQEWAPPMSACAKRPDRDAKSSRSGAPDERLREEAGPRREVLQEWAHPMTGPGHRAGFVALVGRPNVGKSTLLNRLVGEKMAIVSRRPQTTRTRITGIKHLPEAQIVFVDTPGLHEAAGKLGQLMAKTVERALEDVDVVCLILEATGRPERLDATLLERLQSVRAPVYAVVNKTDLVASKSKLLPLIAACGAAFPFTEIVPVSAQTGENCDRLLH